ncbi:RNA polymerase sigma factor sigA [Tanacetum coccineum]
MGKNTFGSKWLFKKKTDKDGVVHTYKAYLVAKGYTQTTRELIIKKPFTYCNIRAIRILIAQLRTMTNENLANGCQNCLLYGYSNERFTWSNLQGVSRALMENSRIQRLPTHLHERQSAIRHAKVKLEEQGITPSIDAITKVFSLDRGANGHLGQTLDTDIPDNCMENNPWHGVDEAALKDEVNKLITTTLGERERYIIRLYYGLDNECLTWEEIGKRIGLSREGVRKIGLAAVEKLKHAAKKTRLETMLVKH